VPIGTNLSRSLRKLKTIKIQHQGKKSGLEKFASKSKKIAVKRNIQPTKFLKIRFAELHDKAKKLARSNGSELCGLIVNNGLFCELIQLRNKCKRGGGFSFYFTDVRIVQTFSRLVGHEIIGTFHSHPLGLPDPGPSDIRNAVDDSIMLIFDATGQAARLWYIKGGKAKRIKYSLSKCG
jgi:proteasome lid subunit RPN8/RPN11